MKHFKHPCPVTYDTEQFLLWTPGQGACTFEDEAEAQKHYNEDRKDSRPVRAFRFNPAFPEETRDMTVDFEEEYLASLRKPDEPEDDEPEFNPRRSALLQSVGQYVEEANRRG